MFDSIRCPVHEQRREPRCANMSKKRIHVAGYAAFTCLRKRAA